MGPTSQYVSRNGHSNGPNFLAHEMWARLLLCAAVAVGSCAAAGASQLTQRLALHAATAQYPSNPKPCNELGAMLVAAARPRAALRQYETALSRSASVDDDDGWDASINLALCLVTLAEARPRSPAWLERLPEARGLVYRCLVSTPSDTRLLELLERADALGASRTVDEARDARRIVTLASDAHQRRSGVPIVRSWSPTDGVASADGATLLICFAGADANLGGGIRGGVPSHEFVASCRRAGVSHAIFVRDCLRAWYTRGIGTTELLAGAEAAETGTFDEELASRSFAGVVSHLRSEIDDLSPSRVVTIGSSMGGYAAVRAGIALEAHTAVAFSPQVLIDAALREGRQLGEQPFDGLLRTLRTTADAAGVPLPSLDDCVRDASPSCSTSIELHAGSLEVGDVAEAMLLVDAVEARSRSGLSCTLTVHEGRDHNLVKEMRDEGELHSLLRRVAGLTRESEGDEISEEFVGFQDCGDI